MARNKYPEETVQKILDTAERQFNEKGYDNTSLQDIIQATGLSKGAIYHHFTSKEALFYSVCDRIGRRNAQVLARVQKDTSLNGLEKLRAMFRISMQPERQDKMFSMMPYLLDNAKFLAAEMGSLFAQVAPEFVEPVIRQGMEDGSISTDCPRELAEALLLLSDIWINPIVRPSSPAEIRARCGLYNQMFRPFGISGLIDEEMIETLTRYGEMAGRHQPKPGR